MKIILFITLLYSIISAGNYADWETITNMNEIQDIVFDDEYAWVATTGGIYSYNLSDHEIKPYNNLDGLSSMDLGALEVDNHGNLVAGGETGILEVYNRETDQWFQLSDLEENPISDILFNNDTLWIAAGKGVAVFLWNENKYKFYDFYDNFNILPNQVSRIKLFAQKIWLGTDRGLFCAPSNIGKYTINNPALWDIYTTDNGLTHDNIVALEVIDDKLWVGTSEGLVTINSTFNVQVEDVWGTEASDAVSAIYKFQGEIYIANNYKLYTFVSGTSKDLKKSFSTRINCIKGNLPEYLWIGLDNFGIYQLESDTYLKQDGPGQSPIRFVIKDSDNNIWASSGKFKLTPNKGFYVYNGDYWTNYDYRNFGWSDLGNTDIIFEDPYQNVWLGSWGGGLMVSRKGDFEYFHNYENSGIMDVSTYSKFESIILDPNPSEYRGFFSGVPSYSNYEVIGAIAFDNFSRLWVSNYFSSKSDSLIAIIPYTSDGFISLNSENWFYIGDNEGLSGLTEGGISCIAFDDFYHAYVGTFWNGLYIFDYQNKNSVTLTDHYTLQKNLYNNRILSLQKDQDGIIWIGTASGLNSYDGVNLYRHVGDPEGNSGPLDNQINQIFVDQANNKWFATAGGLSILRGGRSPWDSTAWIGFNTKNSGLVDNNVNTVFVDSKSAEALIGTENGLSIYRGSFAEIQEEYDKMICGPNPFIIGNGSSTFIIRNLLYNSEVKILTINGQLVRKLTTNNGFIDGGRAVWDGLDLNGRPVASGVYLYIAYSESGKSKAGKFAVIRD